MTLPIVLVIVGILLIIVEIIIVPGFGVPGIIGTLAMFVGVYLGYGESTFMGHVLLVCTVIISSGLAYWAFKGDGLDRMALKNSISSKVNTQKVTGISKGEEGISVSRLSPTGDARFAQKVVEVQSTEGFIPVNVPVIVQKVENNTIFVSPKS